MISFRDLGQMGRLGNQLFQIAATIALAERNNDKYVFPRWEYENHFSLYDCFSTSIETTETFRETGFVYAPIVYRSNMNLNGFFQSEKYFEDQKDLIYYSLTPKIGFGIKYNHASIHVRRGDYLHLTNEYQQLNMDYYQKAMETIKAKNYIIFSDDINWCKENFRGDNISYAQGSVVEDLALMLSCEHNIIANSSFSWWGAYLNKNPSKIVVAPQHWFGPALPHNTKDLIPDRWLKI